MSQPSYTGPKLPRTLLDQVHSGIASKRGAGVSRKDRRKAERQHKKPTAPPRKIVADITKSTPPTSKRTKVEKVKSRPKVRPRRETESEPEPEPELEFESDVEANGEDDNTLCSPKISRRAAKAGLVNNDAEIAALEKKLGVKNKTSNRLPEDDLDFLLGPPDDSDDESIDLKRKRPADVTWLRDKRSKASNVAAGQHRTDPLAEGEASEADFDGFDSDGSENSLSLPVKLRENPYFAPVSTHASSTGKYIPPSMRKAAVSDEDVLQQLRRQIQGLLNRLSEANLVSIVESLEHIYENNARQHVTSTLVHLLTGLVSDPSPLNDTFLILHAGFAAAVYKVVGIDFGAQLLEKLVQTFDQHHNDTALAGKQASNMLSFLAILYSLHVVGSSIIFDYIRLLLEELSETNTELLLRIVRTSGPQLRQDDPSSLKDIVLLLQRNIAKIGEENLSVRTKFMIETIHNLKNNRMKSGVAASALVAEHITHMKKTIGSLNTRMIKTNEPLRVTLADIRDSEKKGKWWLIGASYRNPSKLANGEIQERMPTASEPSAADPGSDSETPGPVSLQNLARAQGMNTDVRRAIFISVLSASDYQDAYRRLLKLHLTSKQEFEIPRVLLHCARAELVYNPYYTLIARQLCARTKLKKAFQFALWDVFRRLGEQSDDEDGAEREHDDHAPSAELGIKPIVNLAKLYGTLVADGRLRITILKTLDFAYLQAKTSMFAELMLTTVMLQTYNRGKSAAGFEQAVREVFLQARMASPMASGLRYFIEGTVARAEMTNGKAEKKILKEGCKVADMVLGEVAEGVTTVDEELDEEED